MRPTSPAQAPAAFTRTWARIGPWSVSTRKPSGPGAMASTWQPQRRPRAAGPGAVGAVAQFRVDVDDAVAGQVQPFGGAAGRGWASPPPWLDSSAEGPGLLGQGPGAARLPPPAGSRREARMSPACISRPRPSTASAVCSARPVSCRAMPALCPLA